MERISGDGFFSYRRDIGSRKDSRRAGRTGGVKGFFTDLQAARDAAMEERVSPEATEAETAELLDAVFEAGDRLKRRRDSATLAEYRDTVRRFLSAVVDRAMAIDERTSGSNIMKRKRYTLVQVIDTKLEQLAAGMISTQREQLDLLARVDEINGLLIDLSH